MRNTYLHKEISYLIIGVTAMALAIVTLWITVEHIL